MDISDRDVFRISSVVGAFHVQPIMLSQRERHSSMLIYIYMTIWLILLWPKCKMGAMAEPPPLECATELWTFSARDKELGTSKYLQLCSRI